MREDEIKAAFEKALGRMLERRSEIFSAYETMIASLTDTARQERELEHTQERIDEINLEMEHMVCKNAKTAQNQNEYNRTFDVLSVKYNALKERIGTLKAQPAMKSGRRLRLEAFMAELQQMNVPFSFDEHTFTAVVDQVVVYSGKGKKAKKLVFCFRDGTQIQVEQ